MMRDAQMHERRLLIIAPIGRDAELMVQVVQRAGIEAAVCADLSALEQEVTAGVGAVILTQEALSSPTAITRLFTLLDAQPPWSDLPMIVLASAGMTASIVRLLGTRVNATILERPVGAATLISAARVALRARQRQHDLRSTLQTLAASEAAARQARAEAEAAARLRDDVLAHDLKNPLGAIKGHVQLLQRRATKAGTAETVPFAAGLATIDALVSKTVAQIDELLDVARLHAGQPLHLDRRPTDLVALVRRSARDYQSTTTRHHLSVETALPDLVGPWDPLRIERVVGNLLSNAIKYSPEGGEIGVVIEREDQGANSWACLTVRDAGIGIPSEDLPHIFERFHRARNTTGRIVGTGLGLAGARQIVEQHGGTIAVASTEGTGTTITVRLPLDDHWADGATPTTR